MSGANLLTLWSDQVAISVIWWMVLVIGVMYVARDKAHQAIRAFTKVIHKAARIAARTIQSTEKHLKERNRQVLLQHGRVSTERHIEREFQRVAVTVNRDLSGYPSMQRKLKEQITKIDEDYQQTAEVPPSPPNWLEAIEHVAKIPGNGDPTVAKILDDIHCTLKRANDKALSEYRDASKRRHGLLKHMLPYWRKMTHSLETVEKRINNLDERSKIIDNQMDQYAEILKQTDQSAKLLSSSSLTQFFIAGLVLVIAALGGFINFQLIALPMSEMVGAGTYVGATNWQVSDVAAMVIISVEIAMGLFLMEAIGVTRLFPVIGSMDDKLRTRIAWILFSFLFAFASIESALAYMRDIMATDREALTQALAGVQVVQAEYRWIPSIGQMVMGFVLPFALTFVAIPLESFIHSSRTVLGVVAAAFLRFLAFFCRFFGNISLNAGSFVINIYDLIVIVPLRVEQLLHSGHSGRSDRSERGDRNGHEIEIKDAKPAKVVIAAKKPKSLPGIDSTMS